MLSDEVMEFIQHPTKPKLIILATRDEKLQPHIIRGFGPTVDSDRVTCKFYIPQKGSGSVMADLKSNGKVALVVLDVNGFIAYQLKGRFTSWRTSKKADYEWQNRYLESIKSYLVESGFPAGWVNEWNLWNSTPSFLISFRVEKVFHQTPGQGTGYQVVHGTAKQP
jgi:hypothetical protein